MPLAGPGLLEVVRVEGAHPRRVLRNGQGGALASREVGGRKRARAWGGSDRGCLLSAGRRMHVARLAVPEVHGDDVGL